MARAAGGAGKAALPTMITEGSWARSAQHSQMDWLKSPSHWLVSEMPVTSRLVAVARSCAVSETAAGRNAAIE